MIPAPGSTLGCLGFTRVSRNLEKNLPVAPAAPKFLEICHSPLHLPLHIVDALRAIDPLVEHDLIDKMKAELPFYLSATYPRCCPRREVHLGVLAPGVLAEVLGMSPTCARTKRASLHAPAPGVGGIPPPPTAVLLNLF